MNLCFSSFVGKGTLKNPFRAKVDGPSIDLRPDCSKPDGWALVNTDERASRKIGEGFRDTFGPRVRNKVHNMTGVDVSRVKRFDVLAAKLLMEPNGWGRLQPTLERYEIWLGGLVWEFPLVRGGASDDFNRANETPISAPWTLAMGTKPNLASNAMSAAASADTLVYYSGAASTANQYAQTQSSTDNPDCGPAVRVSASVDDAYFLTSANVGNVYWKCVATTVSSFASTGFVAGVGAGNIIKLEVSGSTLTKSENGVAGTSTTDTSISAAGDGVGVFMFANTLDNWQGADISVPSSGASIAWVRA